MRTSIIVFFAKYNYNDQGKEDEIGKAYNTHGAKGNAYRVLVGKPEGKMSLETPTRSFLFLVSLGG
jgi:hypothetical protein